VKARTIYVAGREWGTEGPKSSVRRRTATVGPSEGGSSHVVVAVEDRRM
jgi:hypothetical protein